MDKLHSDLVAAQDSLKALQDDLPGFEALVRDADAELVTLKAAKDIGALAESKGRVNVARELLEQHQADIRSAQAEVQRLELNLKQEQQLAALAELADQTAHLHDDLTEVVSEGAAQLQSTVERLRETVLAIRARRREFAALADDLTPGVALAAPPGDLRAAETLFAKLGGGAALAAVLNLETGHYTRLDRPGEPLPAGDVYAVALWAALVQTTPSGTHDLYRGLRTPSKAR